MASDQWRILLDVLDGWQGQHVAVRVVAGNDELIAVFLGTLRRRPGTKGSSAFWPVDAGHHGLGVMEEPGIYAHRELVADVRLHPGRFVVEFTQAEMTVNVRRIDDP